MTDEERLDAIDARISLTTGGRWIMNRTPGGLWWMVFTGTGRVVSPHVGREDDAEFIAHARDDMEWLVEQLQQARAERDAALTAISCEHEFVSPGAWPRMVSRCLKCLHMARRPSNLTEELVSLREIVGVVASAEPGPWEPHVLVSAEVHERAREITGLTGGSPK